MTIGKNSRKNSVRSSIRAPKFLDKSSGFYGRLDEPEATTEEVPRNEEQSVGDDSCNEEGRRRSGQTISAADEEVEVFDFSDDGETLLRRKPSRLSSRWRRSTRKKEKEGDQEEKPVEASVQEDIRVKIEMEIEEMRRTEEENEKAGLQKEPTLVHFTIRGDADDQILIRDKKRVREEEEEEDEEERKMKREQEEGMKVLKRKTVKNYRKAFDRALRRGWETFITNLHSVTLTPVSSSSSSSSPSLKKKNLHSSVLAEF